MARKPQTMMAEAIRTSLSGPVPGPAKMLADLIDQRFPGCAVLLYGSGISVSKDDGTADLLYDFYVIVPPQRKAYAKFMLRFAGKALPPNVFYLEAEQGEGRPPLRCKYAVLTLKQFRRLVAPRTFHSYFWGRFAQPCRLVTPGDVGLEAIAACQARAVETFVGRALPLAPPDGDVRALWQTGLAASYRAELRAEQPERVAALLDAYGTWPDAVTDPQISPLQGGSSFAWRVRTIQGAGLSVARLLKGIFTFEGGMDYVAWKITRHAGFKLPVKPWERRWPLLGTWTLAARYYRMKARQKL